MKLNLSPAPHVHAHQSTKILMRNVLIALIPCVVAAIGFFGFNALMVLGCQSSEAAKLVAKLDATLPTEEIIRLALIEMAKGM